MSRCALVRDGIVVNVAEVDPTTEGGSRWLEIMKETHDAAVMLPDSDTSTQIGDPHPMSG